MALTNIQSNIILDVYNYDTTPTTIKAIQLDSASRYVAAEIRNNDSPYDITSTATIQLTVLRPDGVAAAISGTAYLYDSIYGAYAEMTAAALAKSGKLKGQFKITSGSQVLRTEIFTISTGEALDDTDEWAGEYDGHNLDEMATAIGTNTSNITTLQSDVSALNADITAKVDKVTGKGLSTNDYTDAEKQKVTDATADLTAMTTATASDEGKALKAKTVTDGKVTEWEFGEAGGGDTSALETLVNSMNDFGSVSEDVDLTSSLLVGKYYNTKGAIGSTVNTTPSDFANANCGYWQVSAGDQFVVTGRGGDGSRIWCFTDSEYKILSHANANVALTSETLTASADGYLFINVYNNQARQVIRKVTSTVTLHDKMDEVEDDIDEVEARFDNLPKWLATNILGGSPAWGDSDLTVTGSGSSEFISSSSASISSSGYSLDGDVIYLSAMVKASGSPTKLSLSHRPGDTSIFETAIQNIPTADTWYRLSSIDRQASVTIPDYSYVNVRAYYADSTAQNGQTLTYKCGLAFNLTTIFGKGNEPTDPTVIDAILSQYENGWFSGSQDIWNPSIIKWLAESYKSYMNGTYYGSDGKRFTAGSIIDRYDSQWDHAQSTYGLSNTVVPVDNSFEGGIRTNGMVNVFPKYGRWEQSANNAGAGGVSLFGGHVFEAWNNIRSYRLTMMMGHGGDKVSYTDGNGVTHETPREDEACIIVYSPANSYANPPVTPTEEQSKLRINKAQEDYYGDSSLNMLGRVRIGGDTPTQGTVFTKNKMITYGRIILADTSQANKGKQLVFNNDGTITWTEVDLYQHPEPAPYE